MDSFEKNGLHFRVLDASKKTVAVRKISDHISFRKVIAMRIMGSYVLRIPKTVRHGWKFYTVTEIDDGRDIESYSSYTISTEDKRFKDGYRRETRVSSKVLYPITSVKFPKTIEKIAKGAFSRCHKLKKVDLSSTKLVEIGESTFSHCGSLTKVELPDTVKVIGEMAFFKCQKLEKVDLSSTKLVEIGRDTFYHCDSLTKVELPDTVKVIGKMAFFDCDELEKVDLSSTKLVEIGDNAFRSCDKLTKVELPDTVKVIGKEAFAGCEKLQEIHIPTSLEKIGESAFCACKSLKEIKIPSNVYRIGWEAFKYISKLKVTIYNSKDKVNSSYAFDEDAIIEYKDKGL